MGNQHVGKIFEAIGDLEVGDENHHAEEKQDSVEIDRPVRLIEVITPHSTINTAPSSARRPVQPVPFHLWAEMIMYVKAKMSSDLISNGCIPN